MTRYGDDTSLVSGSTAVLELSIEAKATYVTALALQEAGRSAVEVADGVIELWCQEADRYGWPLRELVGAGLAAIETRGDELVTVVVSAWSDVRAGDAADPRDPARRAPAGDTSESGPPFAQDLRHADPAATGEPTGRG